VRRGLAALDRTGAPTPWEPSVGGAVHALALDGDVLYAGGAFTTVGGQRRENLAAIGRAGAVLPWNPGVNGRVAALAVSGGTVYVGGAGASGFTVVGGRPRANLAAVRTSGEVLEWNPGVDGDVSTLLVMNEQVWVGGAFGMVGGQPRRYLAAIEATGAVTSWDPSPDAPVRCLAAAGDTVFAGGEFTRIGSTARGRLAAFTAWGTLTPWDPGADGAVSALAVGEDVVYAGGEFSRIGAEPRHSLAAVGARDAGAVTPWSPQVTAVEAARVSSLAVTGPSVEVGGSFDLVGGRVLPNYARVGREVGLELPEWRLLDAEPRTGAGANGTPNIATGGTAIPLAPHVARDPRLVEIFVVPAPEHAVREAHRPSND
jgi:hypothetical protein